MTRPGKPHWAEPYRGLNPCRDAWASALKARSYRSWWRACKRGDWMLWAMARSPEIAQGSEEHVRLCWIICRIWWELAYPWWYDYGQEYGDTRPQEAIAALERWCLNPSSDEAAEAAARAAEAVWAARAAWAAGAAGAAGAAEAAEAARAAGAAWAAEAARAAGAAWAAEAARAAGAAWAATLGRIAEIIREELPEPPARPLDPAMEPGRPGEAA